MAVAIISVAVLSSRYSDKAFIVFGTATLGVTLAIMTATLHCEQMEMAPFVVCTLLLILSIPVMGNPNLSHYSKHVQAAGAEEKMGLFIGVLQSVNGISRSVAPIYPGVSSPPTRAHNNT